MFVLMLVLLGGPAGAVGFEARTSKVPGQILAVEPGDFDGDGLEDIVVAYRRGIGPSARRFLALFFRGPNGFSPGPDLAFVVPRGMAMFDVGEADGAPGHELLYLSDSGVFGHGFSGRRAVEPRRLFSGASLIADPEPDDLPAWDFARDLPGLGPVVLFPTRRDLRVLVPGKDGLDERCEVLVEHAATYGARGRGARSSDGFAITLTVPRMVFTEATGDGGLDLVTQVGDVFAVHAGEKECFSPRAVRRQRITIRTEDEERTGGAVVSAEIADLDGDGIADLALTKVGGGLTNLRTEVRLYRGEAGGGFSTDPLQRFDGSGFGGFVRFADVTGDQRLEMVQPRAEVSILGLTRVLLSSSVSLDVLVRRRSSNPDRFFDPEPTQVLQTSFGFDFSRPSGLMGASPIFGHDFDGDGRPDALLSKGRDRMGLHRATGGQLPFEKDSRFGLEGPGSIATTALSPGKDLRPEVLVWYPKREGLDDTLHVHRSTVPARK